MGSKCDLEVLHSWQRDFSPLEKADIFLISISNTEFLISDASVVSQISFIHPVPWEGAESYPSIYSTSNTLARLKQINTHTKTNKGTLIDIFRVLFSFMGLVRVSKHSVGNWKHKQQLQHIEYVRHAFVMSPCGSNNTRVLKGATSNKLIKLGCHDSCDRQSSASMLLPTVTD